MVRLSELAALRTVVLPVQTEGLDSRETKFPPLNTTILGVGHLPQRTQINPDESALCQESGTQLSHSDAGILGRFSGPILLWVSNP